MEKMWWERLKNRIVELLSGVKVVGYKLGDHMAWHSYLKALKVDRAHESDKIETPISHAIFSFLPLDFLNLQLSPTLSHAWTDIPTHHHTCTCKPLSPQTSLSSNLFSITFFTKESMPYYYYIHIHIHIYTKHIHIHI